VSKGPAYFRPTTTVVDCTALDESMPVALEFSPIGELILYNWDEESDIAMEALGLESQCVSCSDAEEWEKTIIASVNRSFISRRHHSSVPKTMEKEAARAGAALRSIVEKSYKMTFIPRIYNHPSNARITGMYQSGDENVDFSEVPAAVKGGKTREGRIIRQFGVKRIKIKTTIETLVNMLPVIPGCLVYEPEEDYLTLAMSIVNDWKNDDEMVIRAMRRVIKQDGSFGFERQTAIIEQIESQWVIAKWL
jgi:hypothetical protein